MLYKKYHRNHIRRFKKGTKICYKTYSGEIYKDTIKKEPYYNNGFIYVTDSEYSRWDLVYCNGRINYKTEIIENAVQEIS